MTFSRMGKVFVIFINTAPRSFYLFLFPSPLLFSPLQPHMFFFSFRLSLFILSCYLLLSIYILCLGLCAEYARASAATAIRRIYVPALCTCKQFFFPFYVISTSQKLFTLHLNV